VKSARLLLCGEDCTDRVQILKGAGTEVPEGGDQGESHLYLARRRLRRVSTAERIPTTGIVTRDSDQRERRTCQAVARVGPRNSGECPNRKAGGSGVFASVGVSRLRVQEGAVLEGVEPGRPAGEAIIVSTG
jgi:hypothetical protein